MHKLSNIAVQHRKLCYEHVIDEKNQFDKDIIWKETKNHRLKTGC
jgi:hypothetical protein